MKSRFQLIEFDELLTRHRADSTDLLRHCQLQGFSEFTSNSILYIMLVSNDQDSRLTFRRGDLKGIEAVLLIKDPRLYTSSPPKVVEHETEVTKDTVPPTNNGSTKDVQPPVVQVQPHVPNSEPVVTPIPAFRKISLRGCFNSMLLKFASTFKSLIGNKEKLSDMARTEWMSVSLDRSMALDKSHALSCGKGFHPWAHSTCMILNLRRLYSATYDDMTANRNDVIYNGLDSDFLLEEVDAFLALEDDPTLPEVDDFYYDPEEDILLLESFLNDDPSLPPLTQGNYLPKI
ncbi:hypothetical protein Tco_0875152 [Tanacetum coccineum]|uniref:Reverse transcriptase domain-containing protein n=1 Tax=Tanacetum coccineum TaxID=301880 RepID=A0ABQ5BNN4_9ASTR